MDGLQEFTASICHSGGGRNPGFIKLTQRRQLHRGMSLLNVLDCGANSIPNQALPLLAASRAPGRGGRFPQRIIYTPPVPPPSRRGIIIDLEWNTAHCATAKNAPLGLKQFGCLTLHHAKRHNVSAIIRAVTPRYNRE